MNCKQTREAIDTTLRRASYDAPVTSHLSDCPDCRRHADETSSLLTLLSAQPRVQAPADFDFRLRARIARAQAEQVSTAGTAGMLGRLWENFLAQTFSWGQAAAAMAAVAMVITISTLYINHDNGAPVTSGDVAVASKNTTIDQPQIKMESAPEIKLPVAETPKPAPVKYAGRSVKATPAVFKREASANSISSSDIARLDKPSRFYSRETGQFVPHRDLIGAEGASAKSSVIALTF
ncbi:MAG: anti-sigma factor [Blastocatellales bacterium]